MRYAAKVDRNQADLVKALRDAKVLVALTHTVGGGFPDAIARGRCECGRPRPVFLEIKDGSKPPSARKLRDKQADFLDQWDGMAFVVTDVDEALAALGIEHRGLELI